VVLCPVDQWPDGRTATCRRHRVPHGSWHRRTFVHHPTKFPCASRQGERHKYYLHLFLVLLLEQTSQISTATPSHASTLKVRHRPLSARPQGHSANINHHSKQLTSSTTIPPTKPKCLCSGPSPLAVATLAPTFMPIDTASGEDRGGSASADGRASRTELRRNHDQLWLGNGDEMMTTGIHHCVLGPELGCD
jgi:hypothetical protein